MLIDKRPNWGKLLSCKIHHYVHQLVTLPVRAGRKQPPSADQNHRMRAARANVTHEHKQHKQHQHQQSLAPLSALALALTAQYYGFSHFCH